MIPNRLSAAVLLSCALAVAGCEKNETVGRTHTRALRRRRHRRLRPSPTFTVSGTIFETAPTASTRVRDAEVQLSGGVATGTSADGTFTIPNVDERHLYVANRQGGLRNADPTVTVSGANVGRIVGEPAAGLPVGRAGIHRGAQRRETRPCSGTTRPCNVLQLRLASQRRRAGLRGLDQHGQRDCRFRLRVLVRWTPGGGARPARQRPRRDPAANQRGTIVRDSRRPVQRRPDALHVVLTVSVLTPFVVSRWSLVVPEAGSREPGARKPR